MDHLQEMLHLMKRTVEGIWINFNVNLMMKLFDLCSIVNVNEMEMNTSDHAFSYHHDITSERVSSLSNEIWTAFKHAQ